MKTGKISRTINSVKRYLSDHSPEILTGIGLSSMIACTVLAVKATPKALMMIEREEYERKERIENNKEKLALIWKEYIPAASFGVCGIACVICGCVIHNKRNATLAAAYAMTERAFLTYKDKVIETIGEKKEKDVRAKIGQDEVDKKPTGTTQVIITPKGNTLIMDSLSGRYFRSDLDAIKKAVNDLNRQMTYQNYISLNEWYSEIGLEQVKHGDDMGWNLDGGLIELDYGTELAENDEPCIYLDYRIPPRPNFNKLL